jgi:hypothetical protein
VNHTRHRDEKRILIISLELVLVVVALLAMLEFPSALTEIAVFTSFTSANAAAEPYVS